MHSRKQCVRFSGVPFTPDENTDTKIFGIASELGVTIQPSDIMISHRTGKNNPRQIIARIPNHSLKNLLKSSKLIKDKPELRGISINQDLTSIRSRLDYQARQLVKQREIKSTFIVDGKFFIFDRDDGRHIIRNEIDCIKMLNISRIEEEVEQTETVMER